MSYPMDPDQVIDMLCERAGTSSKEKGFHEDWLLARDLDALALRFHNDDVNKNKSIYMLLWQCAEALRRNVIGTKLMLIVSEAAEALECLRDAPTALILENTPNWLEELSDIEIRTKDLAYMTVGRGLGSVELDKMDKNREREHKHGRNM